MPGLNASLHLQSLGWAGPGHPLNPNSYKQKGSRGLAYDPSSTKGPQSSASSSYFAAGGNGLIRPLLVSKKEGNLGLGRRAHEPQKGNEWWLKGFEAALAGTGSTHTSRTGSGTSTPKIDAAGVELQRNVNVQAGKFGGLYGFFVRGETVGGTIGQNEDEARHINRSRKSKKRKSEALDDTDDSGSGDGASMKRKKRSNSVDGNDAQASFRQIAAFMSVRDKSSKRRAAERRELRDSEQFRVAGEWLGLKEGLNCKENSDDSMLGVVDESVDGAVKELKRGKDGKRSRRRIITDEDGVTREETKEERRARRAAKRERKRREQGREYRKVKTLDARHLANVDAATPITTTTSASTSADEDDEDEKVAKHRRKEERRERRRRGKE